MHFICCVLFFSLTIFCSETISSVRQYLWGITGLLSAMMDALNIIIESDFQVSAVGIGEEKSVG